MTWEILLLIIGGGFAAAFVDSVVGGGGLISVPVLLTAGLPPHLALGTNKLAGTMSSLTSTLSFLRAGQVNRKLVLWLFPFTLFGAVIGTIVLQKIPSGFLKPMVVVLLIIVTIYTLLRKRWGESSTFKRLSMLSTVSMMLVAFLMGGYDGLFGPGTGSFLIFLFLLLGFDFVTAAMIAGSLIGSQVAIRQGARYVRPLFICVSVVLVGKQLWDLLK